MYAPFGAGVLVGPRSAFAEGDPFLAGGGAVDLVDLDEVLWTDPPEREEAGSPNVIGAVALHAAIDALTASAGPPSSATSAGSRGRLRSGPGRRSPASASSGRARTPTTLPVATFTVDGVPHALVAARLSAEDGDRRPPRLLLRPPVPDAAPGPQPRAGAPLPGRGTPRRPQRDARSRPGQRRPQHDRSRRHPAAQRGCTDSPRGAAAGALPTGLAHRRLPSVRQHSRPDGPARRP